MTPSVMLRLQNHPGVGCRRRRFISGAGYDTAPRRPEPRTGQHEPTVRFSGDFAPSPTVYATDVRRTSPSGLLARELSGVIR